MTRLTSGYAIAAIALQFAWAPTPGSAQVLVLVSDAEVAAERAAPMPPPTTRGAPPRSASAPDPNAPRIDVLAPENVGRPLTVPFPIQVRFIAAAGCEIDPGTFRIFYGRLALDITSRILAAMPVTREGFDVPAARVPKGSHMLLLEIRDNVGHTGRRELEFEVGG